MSKFKSKEMDDLFNGILKLENIDDCYAFFTDICTVSELMSLKQRFEVALMLRENLTYSDICEKTGASTATISRVKRCLEYGENGYTNVFERLENESI